MTLTLSLSQLGRGNSLFVGDLPRFPLSGRRENFWLNDLIFSLSRDRERDGVRVDIFFHLSRLGREQG
jgi:hypothetical protein